jgi:hypothetical protein
VLASRNNCVPQKRFQKAKGEIMKVRRTIFFSLALFFVLAAAAFAQHVKTDYDHSASFGQYKTYSAL